MKPAIRPMARIAGFVVAIAGFVLASELRVAATHPSGSNAQQHHRVTAQHREPGPRLQ
jgi:hypothetical protein